MENLLVNIDGPVSFEYQVLTSRDMDMGMLMENLNAFGADGWECFSVQPLSDGGLIAVFKREK